jgi:peptidoglycan/LPS O-acetylase OafA/YrhL
MDHDTFVAEGRPAGRPSGASGVGSVGKPMASSGSFAYVPALDGVRAVAVLAVLAFHSGFGWASGGFLGVSVFFTLSGYLITTLLLIEHERTGAIAWGRFVGRRARRLLPASLLCLALVVALTPWWSVSQREVLPGDVFAALGNVANWRAAFADRSYQQLFEDAASPVAHFWSLAIEEQAYVVLPLVVAVALRRGRRSLAVALALLTAGSVAATIASSDFDLVYNGTHTRAAELLVGALAAVVLRGRRPVTMLVARGGVSARVATRVVDGAGWLAVGVVIVAVAFVSIDRPVLVDGGLVLWSLVSLTVVIGALGDGPLARVLAVAPLVAVGKVSYGLYLFHWPVFQLLTPARTGLDLAPLTVVRLAVTAIVVVVSSRWLEMPIRTGRVLAVARRARCAAVLAVAAVAIGVTLMPSPTLDPTAQLLRTLDDRGEEGFADRVVEPLELSHPGDHEVETAETRDVADTIVEPGNGASTATSTPSEAVPRRLLVIGDSTSFLVATAIADAAPESFAIRWAGAEGCGFVQLAATRPASDRDWDTSECGSMVDTAVDRIDEFEPDGVLVVQGAMVLMEQRFPGDPDAHLPGSPTYVATYERTMAEFLARIPDDLPVLVADTPVLGVGSFSTFEMADAARADAYNAVVDRWAAAHRQVVRFPYRAAIDDWEAIHGNIRIDGSHPDIGALTTIADESLVPALLDVLGSGSP